MKNLVILKYYRQGQCVRTERFENKEIATKFRKAYEKSYTAFQKESLKIYAKTSPYKSK